MPVDDAPCAAVTVSVLYFAALRDLSGKAEENVSVVTTGPVDLNRLLEAIELKHGALRGQLASVRVAVNEEFAPLSTLLHGGEVVALIPPVSGG